MPVMPEEEDQELVRNFLAKKYGFGPGLDNTALQGAQAQAVDDRAGARIARGGATIAEGLTGANLDMQPYEERIKNSDQPVKNILAGREAAGKELQYAEARSEADPGSSENSAFRDYVKQRFPKVGALKNFDGLTMGKGGKLLSQLEQGYQKTQAANGMKEAMLGFKREQGAKTDEYRGTKIKQGQDRIDLAAGGQAAGAVRSVNTDPIMRTSSTQLAQVEKGLGRLRDAASGRVPFSTDMKAEVEKDIANILSGGTSSTEGAVHRTEFQPYVARWQAKLDEIRGYRGDINAPGYMENLVNTLNGLKKDISGIRSKRSHDLNASMKTAYSKNKLATQALDENETLNQPEAEPETSDIPGLTPKEAEDLRKLQAQFGGK